jgi:phosphoribosylformylglycinamidine cyclo-ligase
VDQYVPDLRRSVGEELLEPTHIYVRPVVDLLDRQQVPVRALVHITSDGFLNLARIKAMVGFEIDALPEPPPIFDLIRESGKVPTREMYRVFNMGIGFCLVVPDDPSVIDAVRHTFAANRFEARVIGRVVADDRKRVFLREQHLVGEGEEFTEA